MDIRYILALVLAIFVVWFLRRGKGDTLKKDPPLYRRGSRHRPIRNTKKEELEDF